MSNGWPRKTARTALSRAGVEELTLAAGEHGRRRDEAAAAVEPDADADHVVLRVLDADRRNSTSAISRARSASSSDCESWAALPSAVPSEGVELGSAPVAAMPLGLALVEQGGDLVGVELGCRRIGGRLRRQRRSAAALASLCSVCCLIFCAIGSGLGSGGGSGTFAAVALISFFSVILGLRSSTGLTVLGLLLDQGLGLLGRLFRLLDALGQLGKLLLAHQVDRQRLRRRDLEGLRR